MNIRKTIGSALIKSGMIISTMWRPSKYGNTYFMPTNFNSWNDIKYLETFMEVPEINAIINLNAKCFSNGIVKAVNDNGEVQPSDIANKLSGKTNWFQGGNEFKRQTKLFHDIYGNEIVYNLFPTGFKPHSQIAGTQAIFTLPPNLVDIEYHDRQPFFVHVERPDVRYKVDVGGTREDLPLETIIHFNDNRVCIKSTTDIDLLKGESKMKALTPAINNIRMAYESRGVILKNRGALGILSNSGVDNGVAIPLKPDEVENIQERYKNYGGLEHQNQLIITSAALKWQQMSVNPDKLGLYQECEADFYKFCDVYGTPPEMFAQIKGVTYENQKEAEKGMYLRNTIPAACEWIDGFNQMYYPEGKIKLIMTYDHLSIFQEDLKFRGEALEKMVNSLSKMLADQAITIEEYQQELQKFGIGKNVKL